MTLTRLLLALACLLMPLATAGAQAPGATHVPMQVALESTAPAPGGETTLALAMTPAAGWHGYWVNGGDAGLGMSVDWQLPAGVTVGAFAYPVPETLIIAGLMNHVYERPYALLAPVRIAPGIAPGTRLTLTGDASWLACTDQICVPQRGTIRQELIVGDGGVSAEQRARFDGWRAALPQPLPSPARYSVTGGRVRFAIPLPAALALSDPHLFVATTRAVRPAAEQRLFRDGDTLIVETQAGTDLAPGTAIDAVLRIGPERGLSLTATPGTVPTGGTPIGVDGAVDGFDSALFAAALVGALIGGLILNIMPCVFPILSLKALALARAGGDAGHVRAEGFAYTAGAVLTCLALGLILLLLRSGGEAVGWAFQLQRPESVLLLIVLMGAITANLAGLFDFAQVGIGQRLTAAGGTKGAFATGALAAFVATPCSGPFLGAALGATLVLPPWAALPIFAGLGLGLALPFLALALIPALRARLPRPGPWMVRLKLWLALPMALTALALVWLLGRQVGPDGWLVGALALTAVAAFGWLAGRSQRSGGHAGAPILLMAASIVPLSLLLPPADSIGIDETVGGALDAEAWSEARLAALRGGDAPLFVYFTADWCVSCKVNEAAAIDRDETATAFRAAGVRVLVADWTNGDAAITRELARHGRNSVPLYLWYAPGAATPEVLPQILTPAMLTGRATSAQ